MYCCYVRWTRQSLLSEDQFIIVVTNVYNVLLLCEVDKAKLTIRRPVHYSSNQCVQCIACYVRWTRQSLLSEAEEGQADSEDQFIIVVTNVYNVLHVMWGGQGKAY